MKGLPAIGIIGAGAVGQAVAGALVASRLCGDLLITSRTTRQAVALAADLSDMRTTLRSPARPRACLPADLTAADVVVVAARGHFTNQRGGDIRMGGAAVNAPLIRHWAHLLADDPGLVLVVTNPVDLMSRLYQEASGSSRVYGIGSSLDSARYRQLLAQHLAVPVSQISGHVIGEHGDAAVVCASTTTVIGQPLDQEELPLTKVRSDLAARPARISTGIGRTRTGPAGAVLAALQHILHRTPGAIELSRPWHGGVWLGLPVDFRTGTPEVRMPALSTAEADQLSAATAKLSAAYNTLGGIA